MNNDDFNTLALRTIMADLHADAHSFEQAMSEAMCCPRCLASFVAAVADWAAVLAIRAFDGPDSESCTAARSRIEAVLLRRLDGAC